MDYTENKSIEVISKIIENIEKYLLSNEYENAFAAFLLHSERMSFSDRDQLIRYFNAYFRKKCLAKN